jgi:CYTH domain-containing protein/CHAD domain-containing protein
MPFSIEPAHKVKRQVRAVARERLDLAIDALARLESDVDTDVETTVHDVRKRCKEARAVARLVRSSIGTEFDRFNRQVRDAAMQLSSTRDAHALLATLDHLSNARDLTDDPDLIAVRSHQSETASAASSDLRPGDRRLRRAAELLVEARRGIRRWDVADDSSWLESGLRSAYRRGRRDLRRAESDSTDEHLHEWRKGVKTLWYQIRLIESAAPSVLTPLIARLDDLSDALGDDHDLAVLVEQLAAKPNRYGSKAQVEAATRHAREQQQELRRRAFRLGVTLFAESTGAFVERLTSYWLTAVTIGPELSTGGIAQLVADEQRHSPDAVEVGADGHLERERKFLVDEMPALSERGLELRQGYLAIDGTVSARVRDSGDDGCTLTVKSGRGAVRTEFEWPITAQQFEAAWGPTSGRRVRKTRYRVDLGTSLRHAAKEAIVDVFHDDLEGLVVVEVEFDSDAAMAAFTPPTWFGREVTDDPAYTNVALAVHGCPPAAKQ